MKQELRIIITQACNYNCYFCHHEGIREKKQDNLTTEDVAYIFKVAKQYLGIETITITGGEPLLLNNIVDITKQLKGLGCKTTIVTNGSLLDKRKDIANYISKLNISLHSLKKECLDKVINNIIMIRKKYPNVEINLNYALINDKELFKNIDDILMFAKENNVNIKFIELFPKKCKEYIALEEIHKYLQEKGYDLRETDERKNKFSNSYDKSYVYTTKCLCSRALDFESATAFCKKTNDIFITPEGNAKICRLKNEEIKLVDSIKKRDDIELGKRLKMAFEQMGNKCPLEKMNKK